MDTMNLIIEDEMNIQNEAHNSCEDDQVVEKPNEACDSITQKEGPKEDYSADEDGERSTLQEEFIRLTIQKESGGEERNNAANSNKGPVREVNEKAARPKGISTFAKKNKEVTVGSVTSKQPLGTATNRRLSNDRQICGGTICLDSGRPIKPVSASRPAHLSQQTKLSHTKDSVGLRENARHLKHLKQDPPEVEGTTHSSSSPEGSTKPQKTGGLPAYGFSFKCDERAQKRKEFYAKLEEKIHAKEVEKTTMQAKTQENQEAEIKMFRKSLTFKATPMPTFYREPATPKAELKKIQPTRAKSPKLSCSRSIRTKDSDDNSSHSSQSGRFSLDVKLTQNRVGKGPFPKHYKKPLRKSLPKLPSEKTALANAREDSASVSQLSEQHDLEPEAEHTSEPCGTHYDAEPISENLEQACLVKPQRDGEPIEF